MRWLVALSAALLFFACAEGEQGRAGPEGRPGETTPCTATRASDGSLEVECPDGSRAIVEAPAACEESLGPDGGRIVRCPDGTEAVVLPAEELGDTTVVGRVVLELGGSAAGATVEIVGTDYAAEADAEGRFRIEGVPAGRHSLRVSLPPYHPAGIEDAIFLPGVFDAGVLKLSLGWAPPEEGDFSPEAQAIAEASPEEVWVFDLLSGEEFVSEEGADQHDWIDGDTAIFFDDAGDRVGVWLRETGAFTWWDGLDDYDVRPGGILALRQNDEGVSELWFLWPGREVNFGEPPDRMAWGGENELPLWYLLSSEGFFAVDGREDPATLRKLSDQVPTRLSLIGRDGLGLLAAFDTAFQTIAIDMTRDREVEFPYPRNFRLRPGLLLGGRFEEEFAYDVHTGEITNLSASYLSWGWSEPDYRVFYFETEEGRFAQLRGEGEAVPLPGPIVYFSPGRTHAFASLPTGELQVVDLSTGELGPVLDVEEMPLWQSDRWILVGLGASERRLVRVDGEEVQLGEFEMFELDGDWALGFHGSRTIVWDLAERQRLDLGEAIMARPVPGRAKVVRLTPTSALYVHDLESGLARRVAVVAWGVVVLEDGLYFHTSDSSSFVPFP